MKASLDPQLTYAILMGMTKFEGFDPIPPASRNVAQLAALLADPAVLGIPAQQIQTIIDTNSADAKRLFSKYVGEAKEAQVRSLLIYYVGHGYRRTDGQYFLTTIDSDPEWINIDRSTCIDYDGVIKKILKNANFPQTIVIVDACYSGTLAQSGTAHLPELDLLVSYTLTSSAAEEESFFDPTHDYTYFSAELINLLQLGLPNDSESLTLAELYEALQKSIRKKGLKMAPKHQAGRELQPHLFSFCKNKAFDPVKLQIQSFAAEIKVIQETIKISNIRGSQLHLNKLKDDFKKEKLPISDAQKKLIDQIEELLSFCNWYLQYEVSFINDIFYHKLNEKQKEIELLNEKLNNLTKQINKLEKTKEAHSEKYRALEQEMLICQKDLSDSKTALQSATVNIAALNQEISNHLDLRKKIFEKEEEIASINKSASITALNNSKFSYYQNKDFIKMLIKFLKHELNEQELRLSTSLEEIEEIEQLEHLVNIETFKILVVGEFNVGKTTLINAMIGEDVLPSRTIPATSIITILKYGQDKKARLHYRDKEKTPVIIPIEKLPDYLLIKHTVGEYNDQEEIRNSMFSQVEVWWPLEFLKDNKVEIIDSPGLHANKVLGDLTIDYLKKVDVILFLMSAVRFGPSQPEIDYISSLKAAQFKDLFFVVNQWDLLRHHRDKEYVKDKAPKVLSQFTESINDIYFVSALDALEGQVENNPELIQRSDFSMLENNLLNYLFQEKGTIKLLISAIELRKIIDGAFRRLEKIKVLLMIKKEELDEKSKNVYNRDLNLKAKEDEELNLLLTKITNLEHCTARLEQINTSLESLIESLKLYKTIH